MLALMTMLVMPDMTGAGIFLMPAIGRRHRPAQLERHQDQQEDGEPAAHGARV